jgi:hypothetical protein
VGLTQLLSKEYLRYFPGSEEVGHEADHSYPSSVRVCRYISIPHYVLHDFIQASVCKECEKLIILFSGRLQKIQWSHVTAFVFLFQAHIYKGHYVSINECLRTEQWQATAAIFAERNITIHF